MPDISPNKPYRIGRSKTGLGLFATRKIKKGSKIIRYFGPMLDSRNKKHQDIDNKYLFEINNRWTIDGSVRKNIARYINHACRPNAESDVNTRKRKVVIRAVKTIHPGEEINYDYGTDYFKIFLKPIGMPVLTSAFVFVTWLMLIGQYAFKALVPVPPAEATTPEDNRRRYLAGN